MKSLDAVALRLITTSLDVLDLQDAAHSLHYFTNEFLGTVAHHQLWVANQRKNHHQGASDGLCFFIRDTHCKGELTERAYER